MRARVALRGLHQEEGFDVAEDRKAEVGRRRRHRTRRTAASAEPKLSLAEREVEVGREVGWPSPDAQADRHDSAAAGTSSGSIVAMAVGVVVDVEVEVDADPLEEVVAERDEAHFDRHLQVLQTAELFEQVGDFLVHVLRLADDEAQVRLETHHGARTADFVPRCRRDGRGDQVDQRIEVGCAPPETPPGPKPIGCCVRPPPKPGFC